ncbi:hypothetical protein EDB89DRAFT_1189553 [Lactarius sanguifluus]|nr:hypothetical protein EDB89DRAFT_1189553 [Lactarius sanguifluus]
MERSVGSKKSVYGMLMTVLFYTTGSICALRTAAWLAMYTLIPAVSHIIALYYSPSSSSFSNPAPPSPAAGGAGLVSNAGAEDIAGLLFKLVHTAAGHDLLVPVPASMYHISGAAAESTPLRRALARLALLSSLMGAGGVAAYYYFLRRQSSWTWGKSISAALQRRRLSPSSSGSRDKSSTRHRQQLQDEAQSHRASIHPVFIFTLSIPLACACCASCRLSPAACTALTRPRAHSPRAAAQRRRRPRTPRSPWGPATPSPSCIPSAFALAAARVARAAGTGMGKSVSAGVRLPVGVGKMRVVRPEELVAGERRAGEVFVFF